MKQTIAILISLIAVLLLATSFIVAANIDITHVLELREKELQRTANALEKNKAELERQARKETSSAEALNRMMAEKDALSKQLKDTALSLTKNEAALEQQIRQNEKQLRELESLASEYEDLSQACDALEMQVRILSEEAAQSAQAHAAQTLQDAQRIAELQTALEQAQKSAAEPASVPNPSHAASYADSESVEKEQPAMMIDNPAQPGEGSLPLPTPEVTPDGQTIRPSEETTVPPSSQVTLCPLGWPRGIVQNGQTFTDLLLQHNVSWQAMRYANPTLPTTRIVPGTRYCIPPSGSRRLCPSATNSYVMGQYEDLNTLAELFNVSPAVFLSLNTQLAPNDFTAGRVVCVP